MNQLELASVRMLQHQLLMKTHILTNSAYLIEFQIVVVNQLLPQEHVNA